MAELPRRLGHEGWPAALALAGSAYLLTMAGSWMVTDLGEALLSAVRLLERRSLELAGPGEGAPQVPWALREPGRPLRSRLAPLTPLTLAPLLALDRALGWDDPRPDGRLVHLQGIVATLAALALIGMAVRRGGGSPRAAAVAVVLTGFAWPVWRASRRAGPEALLVLLVALFLLGTVDAASGRDHTGRGLQGLACFALPWAHPTGAVVTLALAAGALLEAEGPLRARVLRVSPVMLACVTGIASQMLLWNLVYHGDLLRGGYGLYDPSAGFARVSALTGVARYTATLAPQVGLLVGLATLGWALGRPRRVPGATLAPLVTAALLALFSSFYQLEPERRLACAWPAWGLLLGLSWDRIEWPGARPTALLVAPLLGFFFFMREEGRYFEGPGGLFYPAVLWVELLLEGKPPLAVAAPVAGLLTTTWLAARAVARVPGGPGPSGGGLP